MKKVQNDTATRWQIHLLGDHAILFSLEEKIDLTINKEVHALNQFIQSKKINAFKDFIPAYHTLTIIYDIILLQQLAGKDVQTFAASFIQEFEWQQKLNNTIEIINKHHHIPVCYDSTFGFDLPEIARQKNKNIQEIIEIHCSTTYQVFCLGFMPGFAYMGEVEESIRVARHQQPRALVNAGSVGIAGAQTGIYPKDAPGGWQIIGRTPTPLFDPINLALFSPGDTVSFFEITLEDFFTLQKESSNVH